jgi:hypothetical protein
MNLQLLAKPSSGSVRIGSIVEVFHISIQSIGDSPGLQAEANSRVWAMAELKAL